MAKPGYISLFRSLKETLKRLQENNQDNTIASNSFWEENAIDLSTARDEVCCVRYL